MNTGFGAGIMIPVFLIQRDFAFIVVDSFQQRTDCAHCNSTTYYSIKCLRKLGDFTI